MIGILFIYWIWKGYSNLAITYGKNKWAYFFYGIVFYYGGQIAIAVFASLVLGFIDGFESVVNEDFENSGWTYFFVIISCVSCYGGYKILEKKLQKEANLNKQDEIDDIGLVEEI